MGAEMGKLKVGDMVRIVKKVFKEKGWCNAWYTKGMDKYVNNNKTYTIEEITVHGVVLKDDYEYRWPLSSLVLDEHASDISPIEHKIKSLYLKSTLSWVKKWGT